MSGIVGVTNESGGGSDGLYLRVLCCRSYGRDRNLQSEGIRSVYGRAGWHLRALLLRPRNSGTASQICPVKTCPKGPQSTASEITVLRRSVTRLRSVCYSADDRGNSEPAERRALSCHQLADREAAGPRWTGWDSTLRSAAGRSPAMNARC